MQPTPKSSARILLVDDNEDMRAILTRSLEAAGFSCEMAKDGVEALGWAMAAPFDVIVTDVMMPRLDGLAFIARLRDQSILSGARLIVMTADAEAFERARPLSPDALLKKPFPPRDLVTEVRKLLEGAAEPPAAEGHTEVAGELESLRPAEICRLLHAGRRSGRLRVVAEDGVEGIIEIHDGRIRSAKLSQGERVLAVGDVALTRIFAFDSGQLRLEFGGKPLLKQRDAVARPTPGAIDQALGLHVGPGRLGAFTLLETLWSGTETTVYRVRRDGSRAGTPPTRLVVEESVDPLLRPLESLLQLREGFPRLLSWGELPEGRRYYETELPRGPSLDDLLYAQGPLPVDYALTLFDGVLSALARAHALGIPHGGLDVRRIVFPGAKSQPLLLDHGLSFREGGPHDRAAVLTTPPEMWGDARPSPRSDLYSVGILLHYALAGRYPFASENPLRVWHDHLHTVPSLAAAEVEVADEVQSFLNRMLAKSPGDRFPSAGVARTALERMRLGTWARLRLDFGVRPPDGYRFLRKLGEGGAGAVYEALHIALERRVAVKVMFPSEYAPAEVRERFLREARIAASLEHPHVARVLDAREEEGNLYLIMEHVDGESLWNRVAREGGLEEAEVVGFARGSLEALAYAHERGVIHRDVKPENILLTPEGQVKLADFGIAVSLAAPKSEGEEEEDEYVEGTPLYMSPEQWLDATPDARSDLYSLGASLYFSLVGRAPHEEETTRTLIRQRVKGPPVSLREEAPEVSEAFASWLERLLARLPAARYSSARAAMAALEAVAAELGLNEPPDRV